MLHYFLEAFETMQEYSFIREREEKKNPHLLYAFVDRYIDAR